MNSYTSQLRKLLLLLMLFLWAFPASLTVVKAQQTQPQVFEAVVKSIKESNTVNQQTHIKIRKTQVQVTSGKSKNKTFTIDDNVVPTTHQISYKVGDHVIITYSKDPQGTEYVYITDVARQMPLLLLLVIFLILTIIIGRWQGLASLVGMTISFFIIGKFIIPNILLGNDPLLITLLGAGFIIPITYYISHGLNKKTTIAIISTLITLVLTGFFAYFFVELAKLSGFDTEEAAYLQNLGTEINIKNVLLSGFIIGILAVLNDVTVSQASIVNSLHIAKPSLSIKALYLNAMRVGNDHIASLVNTLVLVYAGASLPLFLLFANSQSSWNLIINQEVIATEIIRTLVSSIGIIAAVPLTTYLAALVYKKRIF